MQSTLPDFGGSFAAGFQGVRNALSRWADLAPPAPFANSLARYGMGVPSGGGYDLPNTSDDPLVRGILESADELRIDPLDLATTISYETAGTFSPTKLGPRTQWGQHRGLIQFGEPQARQYGVDWSDPVGSQLGRKGAVVRYLRERGVRPGMGLLDIYSTINAGAPGLYNRSDAGNGGAPGTVRDKVEQQMAGHRRKAEQLLGFAGRRSNPAPQANIRSFLKYL